MEIFFQKKLKRICWIISLKKRDIKVAIREYDDYVKSLELLAQENPTFKIAVDKELEYTYKEFINLTEKTGLECYYDKDYYNAVLCFEQLIKNKIFTNRILIKYFNCLGEFEQTDLQIEFIEYLKTILSKSIDFTKMYYNLSESFEKKGDIVKAIEYREKYLADIPAKQISADDYNNIGCLYNVYYSDNTKDVPAAFKSFNYFDMAAQKNPASRLFAKNATVMAGKINEYKKGGFYWKRLLKMHSLTNDDKFDYACYCLKQGNFEGWCQYSEARFEKENNATVFPTINKPKWNGIDDISDKTLLIHYEQGFGDTILLWGYLNRIIGKAKKIIFVVQDELYKLMMLNKYGIEVYGKSSVDLNNLNFDFYIPSMNLIKIINPTLENISVGEGYLKVDSKVVAKMRNKYFKSDKLKVGISFAGSNTGNKTRDIPLEAFLPLDEFENIELYSLTKDISDDCYNIFKKHKINNAINDCANFLETASLMKNLDVVITSDNCILNLAGALGQTTYGLFNWNYEFRYFDLTGDNIVWYTCVNPCVNDVMDDWSSSMQKAVNKMREKFNF